MDIDDVQTLEPRSYSGGFGIPMPDPDVWCELCREQYGKPQQCTTDRAHHGHGMIHARLNDLRLTWVCDDCRAKDAAA